MKTSKINPDLEMLAYNLKPLHENMAGLLFTQIVKSNEQMIKENTLWEKNDPNAPRERFVEQVMGKDTSVDKNFTVRITASNLMDAWKRSSSPTNSDDMAKFLKEQGINKKVIKHAYEQMKLAPPGRAKAMVEIAEIKKEIKKLISEDRQQLYQILKSGVIR